jgi:hypothetical protein
MRRTAAAHSAHIVHGIGLSGKWAFGEVCAVEESWKYLLTIVVIVVIVVGVMAMPAQTLTAEQIERLEAFRRANGNLSVPKLARRMEIPFGWMTLKRALAGKPVWALSHDPARV